jgi:2-keto-4-pentenoate hydratase/2-oxohepta-3-ene-1,7-dioic acid hydratase in catechol pathway
MKVARFLLKEGQISYGVVDKDDPKFLQPVMGDIFGTFRLGRRQKAEKILAPVVPPLIYALGLNYRRHSEETGIEYPERPVVFLKAVTSLSGPGDPIVLPAAGPDEVDFEGELAVVIGRRGKNIPADRAMEYVFGYTCANDVSARDWQNRLQRKQWARGKSFDTFCPLGPWIVTRDEIPDPGRLRLTTRVNGRTMQDSSTSDLIFTVPEIVSDLSRSITLLPGTVILTGTPEGDGFTRQPPVFLRPGDSVSVTIEKIGELTNPVEGEK